MDSVPVKMKVEDQGGKMDASPPANETQRKHRGATSG